MTTDNTTNPAEVDVPRLPLPCPFCGTSATHIEGDRSVRQPDRVTCSGCFAEIEDEYEPMAALKKWNLRQNATEQERKP